LNWWRREGKNVRKERGWYHTMKRGWYHTMERGWYHTYGRHCRRRLWGLQEEGVRVRDKRKKRERRERYTGPAYLWKSDMLGYKQSVSKQYTVHIYIQ
jgi:hypothetical protein